MSNDTRRCLCFSHVTLCWFALWVSDRVRGLGLVEYADAFKQTGVATNAYAKTLIPTDEQTQKALDLANENRDLNQQTQLSKIEEAKRKLAEAKAKRDADNK